MKLTTIACLISLLMSDSSHVAPPTSNPTTTPIAADAFPNTWIGKYRGPCTYVAISGDTRRFEMELQIEPTNEPGRYSYTIIYIENGQRQIRPYELVVVDAAAGRFAIDEKNSIKIDTFFIDGALYSEFAVGKVRIAATYRMQGNQILMELITIDPTRPTATGGGEGVPGVRTYPILGVQRAVLPRAENAPASNPVLPVR